MPHAPASTPVLVVLVAHDGLTWLPRTVAALEAQTHPDLSVVAVDNASTDGTREWLVDHLGPDRVLLAERDLGFPAAVSMALDAAEGRDAPYVLLLHDDCALDPDALAHLVAALDADPRLALVGPKLHAWEQPETLLAVGWTVDVAGRIVTAVDEGERDQGQHDRERRALAVSSAGMLVRREVFDALGRFDRRYHLFRDDLDLCWRARLAGYDVEVVPEATAEHVAAADALIARGSRRPVDQRYLSERNTLATLLKNRGRLRLLVVLPIYVLVGLAKIAGFVLTRRLGDVARTVRAWAWNAVHLRETLRLRREVQRHRRRSDRELAPYFGRLAPRVRAYVEAIAEWVAGGDVAAPPSVERRQGPQDPEPLVRTLARTVVTRPVQVAAAALVALLAVSGWPLLRPGTLRGGQLAPWPASPEAFLGDYVSSWHAAGAFGTTLPPSPAQAVLGTLHLGVGGSSYLAPRVLLFGTVLLAWVLALKAAQPFSRRKLPRVVAATAYVLSPPAVAALTTGRIGALVVLAVVPGLVAAATTMLRPGVPVDRAWRAIAGAVLLTALGGAFEPVLLVAVVVGIPIALAIAMLRASDPAWLLVLLIRLTTVAVVPVVLLLPWSLQLLRPDGPLRAGTGGEQVVEPLWRWLILSPELAGMPGTYAGVGFVLAGLLGLALAAPRAGRTVAGLWAIAGLGAFGAWLLGRSGTVAWPGLGLVLTAGAFSSLFALAFATGAGQLGRHAFGWRQLASLTTGLAVAVSLGAVAVSLVRVPWDAYAVDHGPLPPFITAGADRADFRVLVLADDGALVRYEVVPGGGPTMAAFGVADAAGALVGPVVEDLIAGFDAGAAERLGTLGVRYVVVPEEAGSPELDALLDTQLGLEPRPVDTGRVLRVATWVPRAALLTDEAADALRTDARAPDAEVVAGLDPVGPGRFTGQAPFAGTVLVAESDDAAWQVRADGRVLERREGVLVTAVGAEPGERLEVRHAGDTRGLAIAGQVLVLLLTISLALRPPGFAADLAAASATSATSATSRPEARS